MDCGARRTGEGRWRATAAAQWKQLATRRRTRSRAAAASGEELLPRCLIAVRPYVVLG